MNNIPTAEDMSGYLETGATVLRGVLRPEYIRALRNEIMGVIEEAAGYPCPAGDGAEQFVRRSTKILWDTICADPTKRNQIYSYLQRVPTLYQLVNAAPLRRFAAAIDIKQPSVREAKIQMFLPWEKLFLQECHQDINSLDSSNSATFWIPLAPLSESTAVRYWVGSHKEGPVQHEEVVDEAAAIYLERVPQLLRDKYPTVSTAVANDGDVIAINRLVFHQSPDFDAQLYARWSVVIRYDDIAGENLSLNQSKYAHLTPNAAENQRVTLEKVRAHLSQKPAIDWPDKLRRAGVE